MPVGATRKHLEHLAFWGLVAGTALLGTVETLVILKGGTNVGCLVSSQRPPHSQVHWTWRVVHRQEDSEHRPPHQAMAHHPGSHFRPGAAECGFGAPRGGLPHLSPSQKMDITSMCCRSVRSQNEGKRCTCGPSWGWLCASAGPALGPRPSGSSRAPPAPSRPV